MKLHEITNSNQFLTDEADIKEWLKQNNVLNNGAQMFLDEDGVNLYALHSFITFGPNLNLNGKNRLPIKLADVECVEFTLDGDRKIESLLGLPDQISGNLVLKNMRLRTLEFLPKKIKGELKFHNCDFTLVGISNFVEYMEGITFNACNVTDGGIGLMQIEGLRPEKIRVINPYQYRLGRNWVDAMDIIARSLENGADIFDCQDELIAERLSAFTKF